MRSCLKIALIPAYNPESYLINLVQKLKEKGFWILVTSEIQIRTIAIDFWATLEQQIKYKKHVQHDR